MSYQGDMLIPWRVSQLVYLKFKGHRFGNRRWSMVHWSMNFICSLAVHCTQCCTNWHVWLHSLKLTCSNLKQRHPKRKRIFQPSIFRGELLVSGRVSFFHTWLRDKDICLSRLSHAAKSTAVNRGGIKWCRQ